MSIFERKSGKPVRPSAKKATSKQEQQISDEERERRFKEADKYVVPPPERVQKLPPEERWKRFDEAGKSLQAELDTKGITEEDILKAIKEAR